MPKAKRQPRKKKSRVRVKATSGALKFVRVTARNYGNKLKGVRIHYEGAKPSGLRPDGTINLGKNVLEILMRKFGTKFRWIISEDENSIKVKYNIARVKTS